MSEHSLKSGTIQSIQYDNAKFNCGLAEDTMLVALLHVEVEMRINSNKISMYKYESHSILNTSCSYMMFRGRLKARKNMVAIERYRHSYFGRV